YENYVDESDYEINVDYEPYIFCYIYSYYTSRKYPERYNKKILEIFDYFLIELPDRRWEGRTISRRSVQPFVDGPIMHSRNILKALWQKYFTNASHLGTEKSTVSCKINLILGNDDTAY
ncbi:154_t:CDS:2, partial [Dentiscutata heterogama]